MLIGATPAGPGGVDAPPGRILSVDIREQAQLEEAVANSGGKWTEDLDRAVVECSARSHSQGMIDGLALFASLCQDRVKADEQALSVLEVVLKSCMDLHEERYGSFTKRNWAKIAKEEDPLP